MGCIDFSYECSLAAVCFPCLISAEFCSSSVVEILKLWGFVNITR
jgi:hypothetical protein